MLLDPGQAGDSPMFAPLLAHLRVRPWTGRPRTRPDAVLGDKAYSSRAIREHLRSRGIRAVIPEPADQTGHRKRRGSARRPATRLRRRRLQGPQRHRAPLQPPKQWRGLATRYDKLAITYRGGVVLARRRRLATSFVRHALDH